MYTICFDTICAGYAPVESINETPSGEVREPVRFATLAEAEAELASDPEFYDECFACPLEHIGHKTIFTGR